MTTDFSTQTGRFSGEQSRRLNEVILRLFNEGKELSQIAAVTNVSKGIIANRIFNMRVDGLIPAFKSNDTHRAMSLTMRRLGGRVGTMRELMNVIGVDAAEWVTANVPAGSSVAEFIAAIVRDAYFEDEGENHETAS